MCDLPLTSNDSESLESSISGQYSLHDVNNRDRMGKLTVEIEWSYSKRMERTMKLTRDRSTGSLLFGSVRLDVEDSARVPGAAIYDAVHTTGLDAPHYSRTSWRSTTTWARVSL